ncbi:Serine phosphatase RsbU, regulator of sigma subunit [Leptospira biflexa serovar Patoc strain 'Patoc 1 (Ames)']|uniref:Putative serine phosphatase RsbU regulator putative membrane protein putative signal peptide n=1 Tax=Leptospira biflexa serovar Patoc (strain Patoc 1 / ATCC 23582 / Paris) TaxID=456481 RepID=B0SLF3_LEPBP|nr:SpoIIE family protein phosphatase [Leptospira biflexa]ABZ94868.1 Serine phosphatase RsbU, regulator of sigma subunit [Leptospira biflexa serovar Patoc strain 'Patoc 1 (Ames)']ABZ98539.1 Putative serine phosphatase RsbU regulator; putative membrane protein; putative signal peptide [Leptospira biflexa serovar Patoc strain 'Patoc 1 (Paris)']
MKPHGKWKLVQFFKRSSILLLFGFFVNPLVSLPLSVEETNNYRDIGKYFEYTIPKNPESTLSDLLKEDTLWRPNPKKVISFPRSKHPVWLKITLIHYGSIPHTFFLHLSNPVVDLFELHTEINGQWRTQWSGEQVLQKNKPIYSHMSAFPITLSPNESRTIYLKIKSDNPIFSFVSFYNSRTFIAYSKKQDIFFAGYFGAGFMMFFFSLFLAHTLRYKKFFYFFFYLATVLLLNTYSTGFIQYFEFGNSNSWKNYLFPITIHLSSIFGLLFTLEFLETKAFSSILNRITISYILILTFVLLFIFVLDLRNFIQLTVFLIIIPIFLAIFISIFTLFKSKKKLEVILFLLAFGVLLFGAALNTFTVQGFLKPIHFASYSLPLGSALEVFFLSLALVLRVSDYRKSNEQKQEIDLQLKIAQKLQNGLLPKKRSHALGYPLGFRYLPATDIGGDFVEIIEKEKELGLFLCDVSGHGIPAAMIASMTKVSLEIWSDILNKPALAADKIRRSLLSLLSGHFLSAFFVYIQPEERILKIANAGHLPLLHLDRNGNITTYTSYGRAINEFVPSDIKEKSFQLPVEGTLILFTDGVIEARNVHTGELFGEERFYQLIQALAKKHPQVICDSVIEQIEKFQKSKRSDDDITILALSLDSSFEVSL